MRQPRQLFVVVFALVALMVTGTPIGAVRADATSGPQSYLADRAHDVQLVGTINEPDLRRSPRCSWT